MTFLCVTWCASKSSCLNRARIEGFGGQLRPNQLQRNRTIQLPVHCLVDRAHPAFAQQLQNLVSSSEHIAGMQHRSTRLRRHGAGTSCLGSYRSGPDWARIDHRGIGIYRRRIQARQREIYQGCVRIRREGLNWNCLSPEHSLRADWWHCSHDPLPCVDPHCP